MEKAKRYNKGKLRYSLVSPIIMKKLTEVYTLGAEKYTTYNEDGSIKEDGANNWKKGLPFTQVIDSALRHIEAYRQGETIDELGTHHLANAIWNLGTVLHLEQTKPQFDDRDLWYKKPFKSLWLDLDGVIFDFEKCFLDNYVKGFSHPEEISYPPTDWNDYRFRTGFKDIADNEDFWIDLTTLIKPEDISYPIAGYCTSRPCKNSSIELSLVKNKFPKATLINTEGKIKKSEALLKLNDPNIVMVDDSIENFVDCQSNGIVCYLMTRPHNIKYDVGHWRVNNIQELMIKLKTT